MIFNHPKTTNFADASVFAKNDPLQTSVNRVVAEIIANDMEPFSKVEHRGFQKLLNKLEPRYRFHPELRFQDPLFMKI